MTEEFISTWLERRYWWVLFIRPDLIGRVVGVVVMCDYLAKSFLTQSNR